MFQDWDNFYLLIGSAAAALIGLLFVVSTLTSGRPRASAMRGASIYMTPTVFHFGVVLVLSAVAAVPALPERAIGALVALCAATGFVYCAITTVRLSQGQFPEPAHWSDIHCYGCAPAAVYAVLAGAAGAVWIRDPIAPHLLGFTLLALLLLGIRNAWDLVTWLAPHQDA